MCTRTESWDDRWGGPPQTQGGDGLGATRWQGRRWAGSLSVARVELPVHGQGKCFTWIQTVGLHSNTQNTSKQDWNQSAFQKHPWGFISFSFEPFYFSNSPPKAKPNLYNDHHYLSYSYKLLNIILIIYIIKLLLNITNSNSNKVKGLPSDFEKNTSDPCQLSPTLCITK